MAKVPRHSPSRVVFIEIGVASCFCDNALRAHRDFVAKKPSYAARSDAQDSLGIQTNEETGTIYGALRSFERT